MTLRVEETDAEPRRMFRIRTLALTARRFSAEAELKSLEEWRWLTDLLKMSFHDPWIIGHLQESPASPLTTLEMKLEIEIIRQTRYFSKTVAIPAEIYAQRMLHHLYATKQIQHSAKRKVDSIRRTASSPNYKYYGNSIY
jgi:hypothetical protein